MEKEFVPYNQALALKELGFDEPCFARFVKHYDEIKCILNSDDFDEWWTNNSDNLNVKAPLYQQAFRWFREKHKLNGEVTHLPNVEKYGIITSDIADMKPKDLSKNENFERGKKVTNNFVKYETYEEAELVCLKKLIEIVKENRQ
jgi:hypothetical protein